MRQHWTQAARNLGGELVNEAEITAQQLGVAQPVGRGRQGIEHELDDFAAHHRGELHGADDAVLEHVLANLFHHRRHGLDIGDNQLVAAPELRQAFGAFQPVVQALRRHDARGLGKARLERAAHARVERIELGVVLLEIDAHAAEDRGSRARNTC